MTTFETVASMLADYKSIDAASIKPETAFEALGVDSLDIAELAMNLEDEMGITLELTEDMKTVADVVKAIDAAK